MLEAINSAASNASLVRATAEQLSSARSLAANPHKIQEVVQAPFVSPYIGRDRDSQQIVIQIRNGETGKVIDQIPSHPETQEQREPVVQHHDAPVIQQQQAPQAAPSASFGAFLKQVSSLQAAVVGGGTGGTVSISA